MPNDYQGLPKDYWGSKILNEPSNSQEILLRRLGLASSDEEMAAKLDTSGRKWVVFLSVFEFLFAIPFFKNLEY